MRIGYHTPRMLSMLHKSSQPDVSEVARRESLLLARSKYWRRNKTSNDDEKPLKPNLKIIKKRSPKRTKNDRSLSVSSDDSVVSFLSDDDIKQKQKLSCQSAIKLNPDGTVKRKRGRPPLNKNLIAQKMSTKNSPPTTCLKRTLNCGLDTENRKPPDSSYLSKKARISRGQLYEGNFSLADGSSKIKTRRSHFRILSDSFPVNNNVKVKPKANRSQEVQNDTKSEKLRVVEKKSSPRSIRNTSPLKRQVQMRRKSVPSYFSAKRFHCYVLY